MPSIKKEGSNLRELSLKLTNTSRFDHREIENTLCVCKQRQKTSDRAGYYRMIRVTCEYVKNTTTWSQRQAQQACVPRISSRQAYRGFSVDVCLFAKDECRITCHEPYNANTDTQKDLSVCVDKKEALSLHFGI